MGSLVHPTNGNHFAACPSVRPSVRLSVRPSVRPSVLPSREVSGHLPENAWRDWPEILHADVSWPPSELISLWPWSVDFSNFGIILTCTNLGFPGISQRTHPGDGLKFCTLLYLEHLQNWSVYGYSLLIFLILALFWLSETGEIWGFRAFPGEPMEGMAWNFACWFILTTFRTYEFMASLRWFFKILALFWLSETGQIWGFRAFRGESMEGMAWNFALWCILTTFRNDQFWVAVCWLL